MEPGPQQREPLESGSDKSPGVNRRSEPISPTKDAGSDSPKMAHDSMVTVRLSEPPTLTVDTTVTNEDTEIVTHHRRRSTVRLDQTPAPEAVKPFTEQGPDTEPLTSDPSTPLPSNDDLRNIGDELAESEERECLTGGEDALDAPQSRRSSVSDEVDWDQLQRSEAEEPRFEESDKVRLMPGIPLSETGAAPAPVAPQSTAMLLALLEKENAKLATNPKSVKVQAADRLAAQHRQQQQHQRPRPPSMAQLRDMVHGPTPPALRYSMLPPPPMTDLEFYLALVKDYHQTAARLPTLLSNKIRKGIPPPLRGVVWQSMSGARDANLEGQYERLSGESSPYELLIGKDLGRSFPGVDMFRDSDGDGQRMLGRVLKSFSLYDPKIGYCQGLAFLVGPLLMHMPDKQAFCVLVRLMERYDLRSSFLPDLSGLHVRIYQFRELLREHLPQLSDHMEDLQVDPAYVSQWFLSFFAVSCPLPMLFRIYDVIFAEGAPETLMRVALSLMRKNQGRILACTEFEDVMQLLLSRGIWDCFHYDADGFVQDFVSLAGLVSREKLLQLEQGYREAQIATVSAARVPEVNPVATAASRFLGRIWASTATSSASWKASTLSPGLTAPSRPLSMLRRSASKQSLASTLNSMEASSVSVVSSASTEATTLSRISSNTTADDGASIKTSNASVSKNTEERNLHGQIEDLLTALSELQRDHALIASELQTEREQREEDRLAVRSLLDGLRKKASNDSVNTDASAETVKAGESSNGEDPNDDKEIADEDEQKGEEEKRDGDEQDADEVTRTGEGQGQPSAEKLSQLLDVVEQRLGPVESHRSSVMQSKPQLRQELEQTKEQLATAISQTQEYGRRVYDLELEISSVKDQLKDSHIHTRSMHQEKQRLQQQIQDLKTQACAAQVEKKTAASLSDAAWPKPTPTNGGLRELKLGRSRSTPSQGGGDGPAMFSKRTSSLPQPQGSLSAAAGAVPDAATNDQEALLLELVQAKTAEATARQEAEESRQKLESLRKACGLAPGDTPPASAASTAASAAMGVFGRLTGGSGSAGDAAKGPYAAASTAATNTTATAPPAPAPTSGGFWGWRRA